MLYYSPVPPCPALDLAQGAAGALPVERAKIFWSKEWKKLVLLECCEEETQREEDKASPGTQTWRSQVGDAKIRVARAHLQSAKAQRHSHVEIRAQEDGGEPGAALRDMPAQVLTMQGAEASGSQLQQQLGWRELWPRTGRGQISFQNFAEKRKEEVGRGCSVSRMQTFCCCCSPYQFSFLPVGPVCLSVHHCVLVVRRSQKRASDSWNWSYRWL